MRLGIPRPAILVLLLIGLDPGVVCAQVAISGADAAKPDLMPSESEDSLLGPREILFKNGKKARGEILSIEGAKFRFRPYDGSAFLLSSSLIQSSRKLDPVECALEQAGQLASAGKFPDAIKLLKASPDPNSPQIQERIQEYQLKLRRGRLQHRDKRREAFREKFDALIDRRQYRDAIDLAEKELKEFPDDAEVLNEAVMAEYRLHRSETGRTANFTSTHLDQLRRIDPQSSILNGIDAEAAVSRNLQEKWEKDRKLFLAGALENARGHYENFELAEAKAILEKAIGFSPPPDQLLPMRELLTKVNSEIAADSADRRARELEYLRTLPEKSTRDDQGAPISDKEVQKLMQKRTKQAQNQRLYDYRR